MRRTFGLSVAALLGVLALSFAPAHAEVGITIDQTEGDVLFSLPALPPETGGYPAEVPTKLTGTATFNNAEGSVGVLMVGISAPLGGPAALDCDEAGTTCTWSYTVPFFITPGEYQVFAQAVDADETVVWTPCNPEPAPEGPTCVGLKVMVI